MLFNTKKLLVFLTLFALLHGALLAADTMRFAFLTDIHVTPGNAHDREIRKVIQEINDHADQYDFAIVSGDICNMGSNEELDNVFKILSALKIPYHIIPGNHETTWSENAGLTFLKLWGNDRFAFRHGNYFFVAFNTGPYMKMGDGHVKAEDLRWLEKTLSENMKDPATKLIVVSHYPLKDGLGNWNEVTAILKKYKPILSICGHEHNVKLMNFDSFIGIMGRPLLYGSDEPSGYNIVEVKDGVVSFWAKKLGEDIGQPNYQYQCDDRSLIASEACSPFPEPLGGDLAGKVTLTEVLAEDSSIFGGIAINKGVIYYGTSLGDLKAFDTKAKKNVWSVPLEASIYSTPMYGDGVVVVGSIKNEVLAFSAKDGKKLWSVPANSPVVCDGLIKDGFYYTGLGTNEFCKIELKTGKVVWKFSEANGMFQAQPVVKNGKVFFGVWDRHLYCLDEKTGELRWKWHNDRPGMLYSPGNVIPVIGEKQVLLVAPDRYMTALDLETGKQIWRNNKYKVREAMGCSPDSDVAYAKTMDGEVIAVPTNKDEFEPLWVADTGIGYEHVACPLLWSNGIVYVGSRAAVTVALDATTGQKLWSYKTGNSSVNRFTVDENGNVWFTLIEGKIFECAPVKNAVSNTTNNTVDDTAAKGPAKKEAAPRNKAKAKSNAPKRQRAVAR